MTFGWICWALLVAVDDDGRPSAITMASQWLAGWPVLVRRAYATTNLATQRPRDAMPFTIYVHWYVNWQVLLATAAMCDTHSCSVWLSLFPLLCCRPYCAKYASCSSFLGSTARTLSKHTRQKFCTRPTGCATTATLTSIGAAARTCQGCSPPTSERCTPPWTGWYVERALVS